MVGTLQGNCLKELTDGTGQMIRLGNLLGRGGEGKVYQLAEVESLVVKVYDRAPNPQTCRKLETLCSIWNADLSSVCAWPVTVVRQQGAPIGFVMPKIEGATEMHELYNNADRKRNFPRVDWGFLIQAAANLARAVQKLHDNSIIIGDLNQRNVVVLPDATVKLWDCDSYQVRVGGEVFRCEVGVAEYTAPELQGCRSFSQVDRTVQHDYFALAVMIFHMLFLGKHPFAGDPIDPVAGCTEIEEAIKRGLFAYLPNAAAIGVKPPGIAPPVSQLGEELLPLFSAAFETSERPTCTDWNAALRKLLGSLQRCGVNPGHLYPTKLPKCCWCSYEERWSSITFLPEAGPFQARNRFDLSQVEREVKHCFASIDRSIPPVDASLSAIPLPALKQNPKSLQSGIHTVKRRISTLSSELSSLNFSLKEPDSIQAIRRRGSNLLEERKSTEDRLRQTGTRKLKLTVKLTESQQATGQWDRSNFAWLHVPATVAAGSSATVASRYVAPAISAERCASLLLTSVLAVMVLMEMLRRELRRRAGNRAQHYQQELSDARASIMTLQAKVLQINSSLKVLQHQFRANKKQLEVQHEETKCRAKQINQSLHDAQTYLLTKMGEFKAVEREFNESVQNRAREIDKRRRVLESLLHRQSLMHGELVERSCPPTLQDSRLGFNQAVDHYKRLTSRIQATMRDTARARQLQSHLERYSIQRCRPIRLHDGLIAALRSHGIETAADVTEAAVRHVKGFAEIRTNGLVTWRKQHETTFLYDPNRPLTPRERVELQRPFQRDLLNAETWIKVRAKRLKEVYANVEKSTAECRQKCMVLDRQVQQSKLDALLR